MQKCRIIVAGGRDFDDEGLLHETLYLIRQTRLNYDIEIIHGNCKGADKMSEVFAILNNHSVKRFYADWDTYGKAAGPIRNKQMVEYALEADEGLLVAFWDGQSKGTKNIIDTARRCGLPVYITYY